MVPSGNPKTSISQPWGKYEGLQRVYNNIQKPFAISKGALMSLAFQGWHLTTWPLPAAQLPAGSAAEMDKGLTTCNGKNVFPKHLLSDAASKFAFSRLDAPWMSSTSKPHIHTVYDLWIPTERPEPNKPCFVTLKQQSSLMVLMARSQVADCLIRRQRRIHLPIRLGQCIVKIERPSHQPSRYLQPDNHALKSFHWP